MVVLGRLIFLAIGGALITVRYLVVVLKQTLNWCSDDQLQGGALNSRHVPGDDLTSSRHVVPVFGRCRSPLRNQSIFSLLDTASENRSSFG